MEGSTIPRSDDVSLRDYVEAQLTIFSSRLDAFAESMKQHQEMDIQTAMSMTALNASVTAFKEHVAVVTRDQKEAITKSDTANDRRFDSVNEFRSQMGDIQRQLMPRPESEALMKSINEKIAAIQAEQLSARSLKNGEHQGWVWAIGIIGFVLTLLSIANIALSFFAEKVSK